MLDMIDRTASGGVGAENPPSSSDSTQGPRAPSAISDDLSQGELTPQQALEQLIQSYGGNRGAAETYLAKQLRDMATPLLTVTSAEQAHRFTLPSATDGIVSLDSYLENGNVVLVFYRSFW